MKISKFLKERLVAALTSDVAAEELTKVISTPVASGGSEIVLKASDATEVTHPENDTTPVLFKLSEPNPSYDELTGVFTVQAAGEYLIFVTADVSAPVPPLSLVRLEVKVNGSTIFLAEKNGVEQTNIDPFYVSGLATLAQDDEVVVTVLPVGGDVVTSDGESRNRFSIIKIS